MTRSQSYRIVAIISVLLTAASASLATEIHPGRIFNPGGLQMFHAAAYNPVSDEYVLLSAGISGGLKPQALLIHMLPDGTVPSGVTILSPDIFVQEVDIAYNPDRNEYLAVWRYDQPIDIWGIYLDGNGNAIGEAFGVGASGDHETECKVEYSTGSQDYMVVWQEKPVGMSWYRIEYRMIDGDSSAVSPYVGTPVTIESDAWDPDVSYGSVSNKFLVVFTKETAAKDEIYGRFVASDGSGFLSGVTLIVSGNNNQNQANLAYASSNDRWLVTLSDWSRATANSSDALAVLINNAGGTVASKYISATPKEPISGGWDAAGPVTYNPLSDQFFASWRIEPYTYGREVSPVDASIGDRIFFSDENAGPTAISTRTLPSGPQYMLMWRNGNGDDGVHAGLIDLTPVVETEFYVLDGYGDIHEGGGAATMSPSTPFFGFDVAEDMELASTGFYVLDGFGGVHAGGGAPVMDPAAPYFGFDVARDMELAPVGYYVLDGFGGLHTGGGAATMDPPLSYFGFDIGRDMELAAAGFYVLDGFGGVHAGGGASTMSPATPYFGFDIARDMELAATGYYVLDGFGGVHIGAGAPAITPATPYFGMDAAEDLELSSEGCYVLDSYGGVHAAGGATAPFSTTPYFGFDIARDMELK